MDTAEKERLYETAVFNPWLSHKYPNVMLLAKKQTPITRLYKP